MLFMIPPVLNDLRAIHELASQGLELDLERLWLSPPSRLTDALAARVPFGSLGAETFVLYANGRSRRALGVLQARLRKNRPEADITFIAPTLTSDPDAVTTWYRLLAEATNGLGELGCQRIYAQLPCGNAFEEVFRQAGFTVYAQEEVYRLSTDRVAAILHKRVALTLRRQRPHDDWNILRLYTTLTPRAVQQAEAMLTGEGTLGTLEHWWDGARGAGFVFERENRLLGLVRVTRGRLASWLRLYLHPEARATADEMVAEAITLANRFRVRPIYVGVRNYEMGIRPALDAAGFEWVLQRSLMVKHTTARIKEALPWLAPVREKPLPAVPQSRRVYGAKREKEIQIA